MRWSYYQQSPDKRLSFDSANQPHPITFSWARWDELIKSDDQQLKLQDKLYSDFIVMASDIRKLKVEGLSH